MVLIEFKEAALNNAFEELDVAKKSLKKTKLALCNVEDSLCELYESYKESDDYEVDGEWEEEAPDGVIDVNFRRRRGMRGGMRRGMRDSMHDGMYMRMRGYGRYAY